MFEFKTIKIIKTNDEILNNLKSYKYKIVKGKIKTLSNTNLQFVSHVQYIITYPTTLTILEYKVNEISNKPFYIKEYKQKYNLKEIKQILVKISK
ncbi:MAG: hypothetical protein IKJ43_03310 [Bacilli bacterium]|nr:hypothetical protein [Bacilli bacterium]